MKEYSAVLALVLLLILTILSAASSKVDSTLYQIANAPLGKISANK